jgi:hypothetical protein
MVEFVSFLSDSILFFVFFTKFSYNHKYLLFYVSLIPKQNCFYDKILSSIVKFHVLIIFLLSLYIPSIYAENIEPLELSKSPEKETNITSKIHPTLLQWQTSADPNEFAKNNNLSYKDDKIKVYIYLDSVKSKSNISPEIEIAASDENIVVSFVTSEQLDKLNDLDFVERVMLPVLAHTPPIPNVKTPKTQTPAEEQSDYLPWLVIGGIIIFTVIIILKRRKEK